MPCNQYSLIVYRDRLCPGAGQARMAPARWPPARPACCHSHQGNLALQLPQFYSGVIALFAGRGGGASCQAQWSLNPKVPPAPSWSSSPARALAGWQAAPQASQHTRAGEGPAPRAWAPCHHPLIALSPPPRQSAAAAPHPALAGHAAAVSSPGAGQQFSCSINTF